MKKQLLGMGLILTLTMGLICGCGVSEKQKKPEEAGTGKIKGDYAQIAGIYSYQEEAMGGQFTVDWVLDLKDDGTYILTENGPMGETPHEGTYTYDGENVTTGPFDEEVQAAFFEQDHSCTWILEGKNCIPATAADGAAAGTKKENDMQKTSATGSGDADYTAVAYADNSKSQVCDIYLPEGEGPFPVITVYHGGGFMFGDQTMEIIRPVITSALDHGYAVVSADYRKSSEAVFPAAVSDAKAVIRYIRANAAEYGFDSEHIAVWGESAGAYLALMTALTPGTESLNGEVTNNSDQDEHVNALVDFYGPVEFFTMDSEYNDMGQEENAVHTNGSFECKFLGTEDLSADKDHTYESYWETYKDVVPSELSVWIQAGGKDIQVPKTQSVKFAERLAEEIGTDKVNFSLIEGAGHEDDLFYTEENLGRVFEFLESAMK